MIYYKYLKESDNSTSSEQLPMHRLLLCFLSNNFIVFQSISSIVTSLVKLIPDMFTSTKKNNQWWQFKFVEFCIINSMNQWSAWNWNHSIIWWRWFQVYMHYTIYRIPSHALQGNHRGNLCCGYSVCMQFSAKQLLLLDFLVSYTTSTCFSLCSAPR